VVAIIIVVVASPAPSVVMVARAVVVIVVDALGPSTSLDGVPRFMVRPKLDLNH
jgi:hypothetical protein